MMRLDQRAVDDFLRDTDVLAQLRRLFERATPAQQKRLKKIFAKDKSERLPQIARDPTFQCAWQHLAAEPKQSKLIKLIKNAHEAVECNPDDVWSPKQAIFRRDASEPAIQCLAQGLDKIDDNACGLECAHRFALLFVRMELKLRAHETGLGPHKAATAAIDSLADELRHTYDESRERVLSWRKRARAFEQIWEKRPGLLLLLGQETNNAFQKGLTEHDVEVYVECIEAYMPHLHAKSVQLDGTARRVFEEGLRAYGGDSKLRQWSSVQREILASNQSDAMNLLAQAVAEQQDRPFNEYADAVPDAVLVDPEESGVNDHCNGYSAMPEALQRQAKEISIQQSGDIVLYSKKHTAINTGTLEALHSGEYARNPAPQLQIMTQVKVPDTAQSIQFAISGNIKGLINLFSQGLASPRDTSTSRGFSLVRWALYGGMHNYETVQFLLSQGAVVDEESYEHTWDFAFRGKCNAIELAELRCITLNPPGTYTYTNWPEEQQFPCIHQIILGRSSKLLMAELRENPDAVYVTDAMGRTALDWATALAQLSSMKTLIDYGSPLDTVDVRGRTTVLHAVDSHNNNALRILLEAGADPNPSVPTRSSPLNAASFGGLVGMIELLIKFGAKVDTCNPEGRTALQAAASVRNSKCAEKCANILLNHGADLSHISSNGSSPLLKAITHNSHDVLMLFTERWDTSRRLEGFQLLPTIAKFADATTMLILASSDLLKPILPNEDVFTKNRGTLGLRADYNEILEKAFEDLCQGR